MESRESCRFTATLLRTSASGFASLAVSQTLERLGERVEQGGGFEAWQAQFRTLVLDLAAAVEDGGREELAAKVGWTRDAFAARNLQIELLRTGVEELGKVLEESLPSEAWAPLPEFFAAARRELEREQEPDEASAPGGPLDELAGAYLAILGEGDGARAIALVVDAVRDGRVSIPDALDGVLTLAMREIGRLWHTAEWNVAEEHFGTYTTIRLLERIVALAPEPVPAGRTVVLTMVEGDAHDLGLRIVAAFFEIEGWRTICLGANTPAVDLALAARKYGADLVVLGATLNTQRDAVARTVRMLRDALPDVAILVGGHAFSGLEGRAAEIGADGCSLLPRETVRMGRELVDPSASR